MDRTYAPKQSCPRDLGYFQCGHCARATIELAAGSDRPVEPKHCGREFDGQICGETHLGYAWCDECQQAGKHLSHEPCLHIGQYELLTRYRDVMEIIGLSAIGDPGIQKIAEYQRYLTEVTGRAFGVPKDVLFRDNTEEYLQFRSAVNDWLRNYIRGKVEFPTPDQASLSGLFTVDELQLVIDALKKLKEKRDAINNSSAT